MDPHQRAMDDKWVRCGMILFMLAIVSYLGLEVIRVKFYGVPMGTIGWQPGGYYVRGKGADAPRVPISAAQYSAASMIESVQEGAIFGSIAIGGLAVARGVYVMFQDPELRNQLWG